VPRRFKGKCRIEIVADVGPFEYTTEAQWFTVD
jgi:hypothetical protein